LKNFTTKNKTKKEHANDVINGVQSDCFLGAGHSSSSSSSRWDLVLKTKRDKVFFKNLIIF
jgi:hypothetical protein